MTRKLIAALVVLFVMQRVGLARAERWRPELLWDSYGVPHIFAPDAKQVFYAFGWAQMESHGDLLLRLYGQARGRAAEYWGEQYLASDKWVRTNGVPELGEKWYRQQSPQFREYLDAFAAGINAYAAQHPIRLGKEGGAVIPVTAADVMAHVANTVYFTFIINQDRLGAAIGASNGAGSNAWAIGPKRSASGNALLLINPHLAWTDRFLMYEAQLNCPQYQAYGATFVGFPVLGTAFNSNLGWTHTVNAVDAADLYELTPAEGGYRFDGEVRPFTSREITLSIKQASGVLRSVPLTIRSSLHGPVVGERKGRPIALKIAGLDQPAICEQWWDMGRASSLERFEAAVQRLQIPMFNIIYADRAGHIMNIFNGRLPVRPEGQYDWAGVVPGDSSATLWNHWFRFDQLPKTQDPSSGWLQNANDGPWTTTFPVQLRPEDFSIGLPGPSMGFRAQRSAAMAGSNSAMTLDSMIESKYSTKVDLADRVLDELLPAARRRNTPLSLKAATVLQDWDRHVDASSKGAVLFNVFAGYWWRGPRRMSRPWSLANPTATPSGIADPVAAAEALEKAAAEVEAKYGTLDVPWGAVYRFRCGNLDLPANGAPGDPLGVFRVIGYSPAGSNQYRATSGDGFVAAVEFSKPVRAMVLTTYSNATQPGSRHNCDQMPLNAEKKLRPAWLDRKEIARHLEARQILPRPARSAGLAPKAQRDH